MLARGESSVTVTDPTGSIPGKGDEDLSLFDAAGSVQERADVFGGMQWIGPALPNVDVANDRVHGLNVCGRGPSNVHVPIVEECA